jgi:hypothetical protein
MVVILLDRNALPVKLLFSMINKVPFFYTLPAKINKGYWLLYGATYGCGMGIVGGCSGERGKMAGLIV